MQACRVCSKKVYKKGFLECSCCFSKFHTKCCSNIDKNVYKSKSLNWLCSSCNIFPFIEIKNTEIFDLFDGSISQNDKLKCHSCHSKIKRNIHYKICNECKNPYHIKCSTKFDRDWFCPNCLFSELPFYNVSKEDLAANFLGLTDSNLDFLKKCFKFQY